MSCLFDSLHQRVHIIFNIHSIHVLFILQSPSTCTGNLDARFFQTHTASARSSAFINLREICDEHKLEPGDYVVVPSTYEPEQDGDFILRVYSESDGNVSRYL